MIYGGLDMYLTITEYAEKYGITRQSVYNRIKAGHIHPDRLRKNDGGKTEIKERDS